MRQCSKLREWDAGILMGTAPGLFDLWARKQALAPEQPELPPELIRCIARQFTARTGHTLRGGGLHHRGPAAARPHRQLAGQRAGLTCAVGSFTMGLFPSGRFPREWYFSCLHSLLVTGWERWYLAILYRSPEPEIFCLERQEAELRALETVEDSFARRLQTGMLPLPDESEEAGRLLAGLWDRKGQEKDLSPVLGWLEDWSEQKDAEEQAAKQRRALEHRVMAFLGPAPAGQAPGYRAEWIEDAGGPRFRIRTEKEDESWNNS